MTGHKLVKLCAERRQRRTRMHRYTSLWTMGADTFRKMSTSFSWMLGSVVMNWFLSPAKSIKESRRTLSERDRISYSRLVNIVEEGVVVTLAIMQYMENPPRATRIGHLPKSSGKAVLSASNKAVTTGFHFTAVSV
jgi:hypothetical protein